MFDIDNGIVSNSTTQLNYAFPIVAFLSIALYNVIELVFIIAVSFRNRHGLYFWSFCVATAGIVPYSLAFLFKGLGVDDSKPAIFVYVTMIIVGWVMLVTGQSVVLYSRLHLVDRNRNHLRFVLAMIIVNGIVLHGTCTVLIFGSNSSRADLFVGPYSIAEKVQVSVFFVQELIISGLYIVATLKFFKGSMLHASSTRRRTMIHLIMVNVIVILLDLTILGLEYSGRYELQTSYKGFVYSVKLKLEFSILNKLMDLTKVRGSASNTGAGGVGVGAARGAGGMHQDFLNEGADGCDRECPSCRDDFIYDGSQQMHTCLQGTLALGPLDGTPMQQQQQSSGGALGMGLGLHPRSRTTRKGSITIASDGPPPPASVAGDGIMVMTTTSVNVTRDDDFERQWRGLRRISSSSEPPRESLDITSSSAGDPHKSASSSDVGLTARGGT